MIKLPKPILMGSQDLNNGFAKYTYGYTVAQLKQAVRDAESAPDCRTCTKYRNGYCYILAVGLSADAPVPACTNGDQYQPAPKVVLWRAE